MSNTKKSFSFMMTLMLLSILVFFISCETDTAQKEYAIGDVGPGGGIVFYDAEIGYDDYSDPGYIAMPEGTRYLEIATENCGAGLAEGGEDKTYPFGYTYDPASEEQVAGTTSTSIGAGKANTALLLSYTVKNAAGTEELTEFAAKAAAEYAQGGKSDWYLPSMLEINVAYLELYDDYNELAKLNDTEGEYYWISSVPPSDPDAGFRANAVMLGAIDGTYPPREDLLLVRAVRAF